MKYSRPTPRTLIITINGLIRRACTWSNLLFPANRTYSWPISLIGWVKELRKEWMNSFTYAPINIVVNVTPRLSFTKIWLFILAHDSTEVAVGKKDEEDNVRYLRSPTHFFIKSFSFTATFTKRITIIVLREIIPSVFF